MCHYYEMFHFKHLHIQNVAYLSFTLQNVYDATFGSNISLAYNTKSFIISIHILKIAAYNNINPFSKIT